MMASLFRREGEIALILGPSGAGKSTVLNILGGMDQCDSGQVIVDGTDIAGFDAKQLTTYRRKDVGFVFQFYNLVPNLTARKCGTVGTNRTRSTDAAEILTQVGLGDRLDHFPAQLSGGEQQGSRLLVPQPRSPNCCFVMNQLGHLTMKRKTDFGYFRKNSSRDWDDRLIITHNSGSHGGSRDPYQ